MTQRELAGRAGVSQPTIARIESGATEPSLRQVSDIVARCGFELRISVVPIDDSDWALAQANLRLQPASRVQQNQAAVRFIGAARDALASARARA